MNLEEIIEEVFNVNPADQQDDHSFMDMEEWDSMNHMIFITKVEEELNIQFTGDEIADLRTIGDLKEIVKGKSS